MGTQQRLIHEFPEKSWTRCGVNKLFKKLWDTGTVDQCLNILYSLLTHKYPQHTQLHT